MIDPFPCELLSPDGMKEGHAAVVAAYEWFLVPRFVIDEAIEKIRDGTITGYTYDPKTASLRRTV